MNNNTGGFKPDINGDDNDEKYEYNEYE